MDYVEYLTVFQSTLPARGATIPYADALRNMTNFNPRSPHGERRVRRAVSGDGDVISIHAPRTGSDTLWQILQADTPEFQSTLPARGATVLHPASVKFVRISIHAPRTGSDRGGGDDVGRVAAISIHAPRTGSDADCPARTPAAMPFQSTLPARGATMFTIPFIALTSDFNPRSPHGERRRGLFIGMRTQDISIHAPRTGSDARNTLDRLIHGISIHAPRTGSDGTAARGGGGFRRFQSTLPARGATSAVFAVSATLPFQSTLPARGATADQTGRADGVLISIHAPRTGSDFVPLPRRQRRRISIHAPRTGSDIYTHDDGTIVVISIHAPRTGSDVAALAADLKKLLFQSTLPARGATRAVGRWKRQERHFNPRSPHGERLNHNSRSSYACHISIHAPRTGSDAISAIPTICITPFQSTLPARGATRRPCDRI